MRTTLLFCLTLSTLLCGCEQSNTQPLSPIGKLSEFSPEKIKIVGLTEIIPKDVNQTGSRVSIYIDLLDKQGIKIKSPAIFRFEIYEYVPRSANPKGKQLYSWPDIDLTTIEANSNHWQDFLRTYYFDMPTNIKLNGQKKIHPRSNLYNNIRQTLEHNPPTLKVSIDHAF